jgi:hypothetical protein
MKLRGKLVRIALSLLLAISLLSYSLSIISKPHHPEPQPLKSPLFPHQIFTFWHQEPQGMIKKLIDSWKVTGYKVVVLNHTNYQSYTNERPTFDMQKLKIQHQADWIRIAVLQAQGGYWIDAAVLVTRPLNEIEDVATASAADCFAYDLASQDRRFPIIDNFFIATKQYGLFVTSWLLEYTLSLKTDYINDLDSHYNTTLMFQGVDDVEYFKMNIAAQKLIQINKLAIASTKGRLGPFILYDNYPTYDASLVAKRYLDRFEGGVPVMLKFTHQVRTSIEMLLEEGSQVHPESIYSRYLA